MKLRIRFVLTVLLGFGTTSHAVLDGKTIWVPSSEDEMRIQKMTVRFVFDQITSYKPFCSGIIAGPQQVLSAGHCFDNKTIRKKIKDGEIFAEIFDPRSPTRKRRIPVTDVQSEFTPKIDLAMVRLGFGHGIEHSIPFAYSGCDKDSPVLAAGFGATENSRLGSRVVKRAIYAEVEDPIHQSVMLQKALRKNSVGQNENNLNRELVNFKDWFVAERKKGQTCFGDSGGPIFCRSKGLLAVAAVISGGGQHLDTKIVRSDPETCRDLPFLVGSRISENMSKIERWRMEPSRVVSDNTPATD